MKYSIREIQLYENHLSEAQQQTLKEISTKTGRIKKADFSLKLEQYARTEKIEYVTALLQLCELYDIDIENVGKYLTETIKQKIAEENGLLNSVYHINQALPV